MLLGTIRTCCYEILEHAAGVVVVVETGSLYSAVLPPLGPDLHYKPVLNSRQNLNLLFLAMKKGKFFFSNF